MRQKLIMELKEFQNVFQQYIKNINRPVSAGHNFRTMKTKTGLTIIHDGNRVNVYTQSEMRKHNNKNNFETWFKSVLNALNLKR